jgi:outer membrane protein TolC
MKRASPLPRILPILILALAACASVDQKAARDAHVDEFTTAAREKVQALKSPLGLSGCVKIALENNLDIRTAQVESRLATLDRKIAFGALLPNIEFQYGRHGTSRPVMFAAGDGYMQMSDRYVSKSALSGQIPIFLPQAWLLYRMRREGEEIGALVETRVRQLVTLEVTALYHACMAHEAMRVTAASARDQAAALLAETRVQEDEGLVTPAVRMRLETLLMSRDQAVADNDRASTIARAELLQAMGLSPLAEIRLAGEKDLVLPEEDLPALVLVALRNRPELHVADRAVRIQEDALLAAIANFLPKIVGFGSLTDSSDSFLKNAHTTAFGVSGVVSIFDGFRNISNYHAAEEREEGARLERERTCLTVMLEVVRAFEAVEEARERGALATQDHASVRRDVEEAEARWSEGIALTSERLDALARLDRARVNATLIHIQEQVALATLRDVVGRTGVEK